tara:strand:- start:317 stop:523 length:207 start_codon:yes stop_codon:yes gene_type:complete
VVLLLIKDFTETIKSNRPKTLTTMPISSLYRNTNEGKMLLERKIIKTQNIVISGGGILFFISKIIYLD